MIIEEKYWIVYDDEMTVFHYGENLLNGKTVTGLSNAERFNDKDKFIIRLNELKLNTDEFI